MKNLQYKKVKLIFGIITSLILIPLLLQPTAFYITYFILVVDKAIDLIFDTEYHSMTFSIWQKITQWIMIFASSISLCMMYPGFEEFVLNYVKYNVFVGILFIALYSSVIKEVVETISLDIKTKKIKSNLDEERGKIQ